MTEILESKEKKLDSPLLSAKEGFKPDWSLPIVTDFLCFLFLFLDKGLLLPSGASEVDDAGELGSASNCTRKGKQLKKQAQWSQE